MQNRYAVTIGSISSGTHRPADLIPAFADELERIGKGTALTVFAREAIKRAREWCVADDEFTADERSDHELTGSELVQDLEECLSDHAPEATYFGAHEGDGADFGFWPCWEALDELPTVNDPGDVENHLGEPCKFVNDHGNVTVYNADGSVAWDCV